MTVDRTLRVATACWNSDRPTSSDCYWVEPVRLESRRSDAGCRRSECPAGSNGCRSFEPALPAPRRRNAGCWRWRGERDRPTSSDRCGWVEPVLREPRRSDASYWSRRGVSDRPTSSNGRTAKSEKTAGCGGVHSAVGAGRRSLSASALPTDRSANPSRAVRLSPRAPRFSWMRRRLLRASSTLDLRVAPWRP